MRPGKIFITLRMLMVTALLVPDLCMQAQSLTLSSDRDSILLGEQVRLDLRLIAPAGSRITRWPAMADTFDHLEVVRRSGIDSVRQGDRMQYTQQLVVTGFDTGRWVIPSVSAWVDGKESRSGNLTLEVKPIRLQGSGYNDIREIRESGSAGPDWKKIGLFALGLGLMALLLYLWWKKRPAGQSGPIPVSRGTAYEEAMKAIRALRKEDLPQKGDIKSHYSRLYDIYRIYLGNISGMNMMQQTTDGILLHLKQELNGPVFSGTAEALRVCDAVKFARYLPSPELCDRNMDQLIDSIESLNRLK